LAGEIKKPDSPRASGFLTGKPAAKPDPELLFEALDVLGNRVLFGTMMMVLGARAETESNQHEGHESNVFHSMMFLN
jgi:hypothetical protein